jgi:DNA modification methylase
MSDATVRLVWPGKDDREPAPAAKIGLLERGDAALRVVQGDNLAALGALAGELAGRVALAYLDPPFLTGRLHARVHRSRDERSGKILRALSPAFDDRWDDLASYLAALRDRIEAVRALLAPSGCMVVHVDPRTSHYVKVLCDEVFGEQAFASELVWRYRRWPSKTPNFQRVHDVLLRYVRDPSEPPRFVQLYEPLAPSTRATWGDKKQRAIVADDGRRARSSTTEEASPGAPLGDVWDIGIVAPVAHERTGYPTQKPEALLERLLRACTREGDLVLDPYAGSGTTLAVAWRLGRRALGIDQSPVAIQVIRERLAAAGATPRRERVVASAEARRAVARRPR